MRFIKETDYSGRIKPEIKLQLTGTTDSSTPSQAQIRAEDTAISTITEYIGGRYDCTAIFAIPSGDVDTRNLHIVKCVIILALFDLYHQSGMKDIPETRKVEYDDTIMWLKDVGRGDIVSSLPTLYETADTGAVRYNSRPPRNFKY